MSYTTPFTSQLKFIDKNVGGNWNGEVKSSLDGSSTIFTTQSGNNTWYQLTDNGNSTYSLKSSNEENGTYNNVADAELPYDLRIDAIPKEGVEGFRFQLYKFVPKTDGVLTPNVLTFNPKYFNYTTDTGYSLNVDSIIADHDLAAVSGLTGVKFVTDNEGTTVDPRFTVLNTNDRIATIKTDFLDDKGVTEVTGTTNYVSVTNNTTTPVIDIATEAKNKIDNAWQKSNASGSDFNLDFVTSQDNKLTGVTLNGTEYAIPEYTNGSNVNISGKEISVSGISSGDTFVQQSGQSTTLIGVATPEEGGTAKVGLPNVVNIGSESDAKLTFTINDMTNGDVKAGDITVDIPTGKSLHFRIGGNIVLTIGSDAI